MLQWLITLLKFERGISSLFSEILERNYYLLLSTETAAKGTGSSASHVTKKSQPIKQTTPNQKPLEMVIDNPMKISACSWSLKTNIIVSSLWEDTDKIENSFFSVHKK